MILVGFWMGKKVSYSTSRASQVVLIVKNLPANTGDMGSIPSLERSPGGGHGNPLQYSCLENLMDRGAQWAKSIGSHQVGHNLSDLESKHTALGEHLVIFKYALYI